MEKQDHKIIKSLHRIACLIILTGITVVMGCATPVGLTHVKERVVYEQISDSALVSDSYSSYTAVVLHRYGLRENEFWDEPVEFIKKLHGIACRDERRDVLLALSELCFLAGQDEDDKAFYGASSVYAFLFILGPGDDPAPDSFDRRFRLACDFYNRSLANVITFSKGNVELKEKDFALPVGKIHLTLKAVDLPWNPDEMDKVLPADSYKIHGLTIRNRTPGLGAPILAIRKKRIGKPIAQTAGASMFLEVHGSVQDIASGNSIGEVSIISNWGERDVVIGDRKIPIEMDFSAPIAYSLNDPIMWKLGLRLFRFGRSLFDSGIYPVQPYRPGLIPVILVHGTASSPVWWAEMLNTLRSDPEVASHFQIWLYLYDSGKPVAFSAVHLRDSLKAKIEECDPSGKDPALRNVVVIGHSQGGLLTRLTAVDTGDTMVRAVMGKSLEELDLSGKDLELVTRYGIYKPLPEVRRVIFICTPHRGSILAGSLVRSLAARLISLPRDVFQTGADLINIANRFTVAGKMKRSIARTSIDVMAPDNPVMLALAELPFPDNVKVHSIIAIKGDDKPPEGDDGVVAYTSAHIAGAESELVVPYAHSCQMEPLTIEEVRRILIEHLHNTDLGAVPTEETIGKEKGN